MDPVSLLATIKAWSSIAGIVFTTLVTISAFALRMVASYIKSLEETLPSYQPSKKVIIFMAILSALSQNSPTASHIMQVARIRAEAAKKPKSDL